MLAHRRIVAPHRFAQLHHKLFHLRRILAIAREQNETQRIGAAEEFFLVIRQRGAAGAEDDRARLTA